MSNSGSTNLLFLANAGKQAVARSIDSAWFFILFVLTLLLLLLPRLNMSLGLSQTILFPFIAISLWKLPRKEVITIPFWVFLVAIACWFVGATKLRGYLPRVVASEPALVAVYPESFSPELDTVRLSLYRGYNERRKFTEFPSMSFVQRQFSSDQALRNWATAHDFIVAITPQKGWSTLYPSQANYVDQLFQSAGAQTENLLGTTRYHLPISELGTDVVLLGLPQNWALQLKPEFIPEIYLGFLGKALTPEKFTENNSTTIPQTAEQHALSFLEAGSIQGPWRSPEAQGVAYYLRGTVLLLAGIVSGEKSDFHCALDSLRLAAGKIEAQRSPELRSMILNNTAVAMLLSEKNELLSSAQRQLAKAAGNRRVHRAPSVGALTALENLGALTQAGIFQNKNESNNAPFVR